jgi:hypothetical protein
MKKSIFLFFSLLFFISPEKAAFAQQIKVKTLQKTIQFLAHDRLEGRESGTIGAEKTAEYIERQMKLIGLKPGGTQGFRQAFTAQSPRLEKINHIHTTENIIGFLDQGAPHTIIIGAHYDHLGKSKEGDPKTDRKKGIIYNGADDNASGIAGLLALARYFSQSSKKEGPHPFNILFIAFGAEEFGLLGSRHFVSEPTIALDQINYMINFDMIGRYNPQNGLGIGGVGTSPIWTTILEKTPSSIRYFTDPSGKGGSDHHPFYEKKIPVLFFHTGGHPQYHHPDDDVHLIDFEALKSILELCQQMIYASFQYPKIPFTATP